MDSIRRGKPLPISKYPIYSRVLEGLCISSTGFSAPKKHQVEAIVQYMGGNFLLELTSMTHYLVASEVGSEKYFVACKRSIPVVRADWLLACWKDCALVSPHVRVHVCLRSTVHSPAPQDYLLSPLAGLSFCVTGLSAPARASVEMLVRQHGGRYSADLTRKCTHLLANAPVGNKFNYAVFWGIPVVRPEWLAECINVGIYVDPRPFMLAQHTALHAQVAALSLSELPPVQDVHAQSRARAQTLSSLSRSHSTTALDAITEVQPASPVMDSKRSERPLAKRPLTSPISSPLSSYSDLPSLLAEVNAMVDAVLTPPTVCMLLCRADKQAHPAAYQAALTYAVDHVEEVRAHPAFATVPSDVRECIIRACSQGHKRRRVLPEDE